MIRWNLSQTWLSYLLPVVCILLMISCGPDLPPEVEVAYRELPDQIDFNLHVKPILSDKCFACHGPDKEKRAAGLRLDVSEAAFQELTESVGKMAIVPKKPGQSEAVRRMLTDNPDIQMPPPEFNVSLTAHEKAVLIKWIRQGAEYKPHWAFIPPNEPKLPKASQPDRVENPIDHFIQEELTQYEMEMSPQAEKTILLRRLSLDLTGLPPSQGDLEAFIADRSEGAYEKQVDRLLASPHYGEKMATDWMDLARYADTYGYQVDRYRDMSPWRDWVIEKFNKNMPYDEFITWQLAGDLLPNASKEQILATGFNRLHPQNMEGGIVDEEFRVEYVSDRVAVLGEGLMGLTLACARCHDHKYDPISQKEYYELFSFFNNINETGQISWDNTTPSPTLLLPSPSQQKLLHQLSEQVKNAENELASISHEETDAIQNWIQQNAYQQISSEAPKQNLIASYSLENSSLRNGQNANQKAKMDREFSEKEIPHLVKGFRGKGLQLNGDAWLDLQGIGVFKRNHSFSIGLWVNIPEETTDGVIFHKNKGSRLHAYRGFHLFLRENKLEWMMAHVYPDNALIETTIAEIPKGKWVHLMVTYDGSSSTKGSKIFINGQEAKTEVTIDNLYKDIVFHKLTDIIYNGAVEPNLQIGARWRGKGLKDALVDEILVYDRELSSVEVLTIANPNGWEELTSVPSSDLSPDQEHLLQAHYLHNVSAAYQAEKKHLHDLRTALVDSMEYVKEVMVLKEMDTPRKSFVLNRGVYDDYGEPVSPNTPTSVMKMPDSFPKNRLGLAKWLTHSDNPLTARVAVNRYWQNYFGKGLVNTTEDFGNQGELPTHPKLLDWLAIQFVESGWDVKALQKLIVMSATYRQSSFTSEEVREKDPENRLLARGPSARLSSEMMRDNALAASGLLIPDLGGESVKPYQPEGLWALNFDPYEQDHGTNLYRRSMYTIWRRTVPNPTLATFDQPERSICSVRRQKTNTPLQALVLLNDPTFLEVAKVMGAQMAISSDKEKSISSTFQKLTGRSPLQEELSLLKELQRTEYQNFLKNKEKMKGWLSAGEYPVDNSLEQELVASYAVVASAIMNADASITKR
ncbi:MAG: DUF1553 domain-containing protein [Bacteroidota bacterium]